MPLRRSPGNGQLPFIEEEDAGFAASAPSANTAYLRRFRVFKPTVIGAIAFFVGAQAGNADVGIFSSGDLLTFTLLTSSGSTPVAGTNANQKITFTAITLLPGVDYYLASVFDTAATLTIGRTTLSATPAAVGSKHVTKAALFPLATFTTPAGTDRKIYLAATVN